MALVCLWRARDGDGRVAEVADAGGEEWLRGGGLAAVDGHGCSVSRWQARWHQAHFAISYRSATMRDGGRQLVIGAVTGGQNRCSPAGQATTAV